MRSRLLFSRVHPFLRGQRRHFTMTVEFPPKTGFTLTAQNVVAHFEQFWELHMSNIEYAIYVPVVIRQHYLYMVTLLVTGACK